MTSPYRILTFDVVGTLIDFEQGILDCLHAQLGTEADHGIDDLRLLEAYARAEDVQQQLTPDMPFSEMLAPAYLRMADELGLPASEAVAGSLRAAIPDWPAFPDSVEALQRLGADHRLIALTNAGRWAARELAATLGEPFDDIVTVEDVGVNKPDPQVFAFCRGRQSVHGYELADFLHVAQSQYHDIGVAKRLGYRTAWVERRAGENSFGATPRPESVTAPDYHVTTLAELADLIELHPTHTEG
ncbi:HAD family hydrolase [Brevibacterium daeguense]|uniref:HAD family hydrolase n=1 Tax=Brevibacterium daeguense TaxID=909936 RepID=A0ABP8EIE5_9MICO|nr:HAD-IA family hydrolase [Brevibacterium daeguense]